MYIFGLLFKLMLYFTKLQIGEPEKKRQVPPMLQKILRYDVQITKKFVEMALRITALRSLRNHSQLFEVWNVIAMPM